MFTRHLGVVDRQFDHIFKTFLSFFSWCSGYKQIKAISLTHSISILIHDSDIESEGQTVTTMYIINVFYKL